MECMNLSALLACAISQVLDPAPAPVPVSMPPVIFEWISTNGEAREAALVSLESQGGKGTAQIRDARGGVSTLALSDIASAWRVSRVSPQIVSAITDSESPEVAAAPAVPILWTLHLTDSQQFRGTLVPAPNVDSVTVAIPAAQLAETAATNAITLPLERLSRAWKGVAWPRGAVRAPTESSRDVLWLANGDVISGFLAEFGPVIKIESQASSTATKSATKAQEVSLDAAAALWLTNPATSVSGMRIGWQDGTVMTSASCVVQERVCRVSLTAAKGVDVQYALDEVQWILPDAARWRTLSAEGTGSIVVGNAEGVLLREPGTVSWPVKPGESHFVAQVSLPPSCFDWGDCTLIVRVLGSSSKEVARVHLDAETPRHRLNIPVAGATAIECTIDPGPSGPVQDRVQFSRAGFITAPK